MTTLFLLTAGAFLGAGSAVAWTRLRAWNQQRHHEWDPY